MYNIGEYVVYRRLNVCKIERIERNVFETNGKEYYKLVPLAKQDTGATVIYLPVEFEQGLRHILRKEQIKDYLAHMAEIKPYFVNQKKPTQLVACYEEIIESGDVGKYLALFKGVLEKERTGKKKVSEIELRYKAKVENLIVTEFAFVLNEEIGKMKEIIISKLQN